MEDTIRTYSRCMVSSLIFSSLLACSSMSYAYTDEEYSISSDSEPMYDPPIYDDSDMGDNSVKHAKKTHRRHAMNGSNYLVFNPRTHTLTAYSGSGSVVRSFQASGGRNYCPDIHRGCHTPTGTFHVLAERGADCRSSRYPVGKGGAPMPYCMFFTQFYAIHGSYEVPNYNASHGCIRVHPSTAKWLMNHFVEIGTMVKVLSY